MTQTYIHNFQNDMVNVAGLLSSPFQATLWSTEIQQLQLSYRGDQ